MANRQFPRNNNRNNNRSNNNRDNNSIYCPQCSQRIQILNGDIQYSLNLHMQLHKPLESIDQDISRQLSRAKLGPNVQRKVQSNYFCPECNENIQVYDGDIKRFLELHAQKHRRSGMVTRGDDQSSTSSGRSRSSNRQQNYAKNQFGTVSEGVNSLDNVFFKMQPGLKAHRGFVYENESGEIACGLCASKIDSLNKVADHLVTKSHEDNTISFIKNKLPYELHKTMDFVSFYGSNLCCNLCRCKIDLSSLNFSETIMNIIANAGQQHVGKKSASESLNPSKIGTKKLNFLSSKDSLVNSNKHLVSFEMQPQFRCKLCDKLIPFDQDDQMLLKNFTSHFSSNGHNKCLRATSVLTTFKSTHQLKGGKHNLVVTKGSITCTVCNISMEPNVDTLDAHVKEIDSSTNIDWPEDLPARVNKLDFKGPQQSFNMKEQTVKSEDNKVSKVHALLKCMPVAYRNIDYIVESSQGQVTCLICNCVVPSTFYNLKTHLTGNSHMKNLSSTNNDLGETRLSNNSSPATSAKSQNFNPFMKENSSPTMNAVNEPANSTSDMLDYLKKGDSLIRKNVLLLEKHNDDVYSCKLCKMTLPKSHDMESLKQNLTTHLSGSNHVKLFDKKLESEITKLMTIDPIVRANKEYLLKLEDTLHCTLCDIRLSISIDGSKLKKSLNEHLKGQQHLNKFEKITNNQDAPKFAPSLLNPMESLKAQYQLSKNGEFANNATKSSTMFQTPVEQLKGLQSFIKSEESTNTIQQPSFLLQNPAEPSRAKEFTNNDTKSSKVFQIPVEQQFKGSQSFSKPEEFNNRPQKPASSLGNPTEPPRTKELVNNATKSSKMLQSPIEQFKGPQNFSKSEESSNRSQKPASFTNPTGPIGEQSIQVKPNDLNFEPPTPRFAHSIINYSIMELFNKLPAKFQSDIAFIKNSSVVEGFLACTLCNINHINPPYLQKHLEEEKHVQGRTGRRLPSSQADTQNSTTGKKMMQNMKNFFGFSN